MRLAPKDFQRQSLGCLAEYARRVRLHIVRGSIRPDSDAFHELTGRTYCPTPGFHNVPYVCLRLPTGGGKTMLAAQAIGTIGRMLLETDQPACLWITPSTTIRDQTLRALRKPDHPYRLALDDSLGTSAEVVTLEEALMSARCVRAAAPLVVVTTIQSYRIRDDRGEELADTRRIYRDNGYLQAVFDNLPQWARNELAADESGLVQLSLANALRLRRPIVIMDEAHNARTPISFDSLARFGPSFVLELTATPEQQDDPANGRFASNVLHAVSALELKNQGMIKLPVDLESRGDWLEVLAATKQRRDALEVIADRANEDVGLPFLRPIALIQAQAKSRSKETHTVDKVKGALIERLGVDEGEVKICTGELDEIGDMNLMETNCPVRYVITVSKLREGWDCPLAWVLGSIGSTATPTAVEQLIGRILRMPNANPTRIPALDRAYAFVLSDNVARTALELRDRMVETCGFDERSADDALRVIQPDRQRWCGFDRIPLSEPPSNDRLPASLTQKIHYDDSNGTLVFNDLPTPGEVRLLRDAVTSESDRQAIDVYWERERPVGIAVKPLTAYAQPLRVPLLTVMQNGRRSLLEPIELDTFAWDLDSCEPMLTEQEFSASLHVGEAALIDVDTRGKTVTRPVGEVRLRQLELVGEGEEWDEIELVRWLDQELHRDDAMSGLALRESQPWLQRVVNGLVGQRDFQLPMLVRRRHQLAEVLRVKIAGHGCQQVRRTMQRLIQRMPEAVETSYELLHMIEEQNYAPTSLHNSGHQFAHHGFDLIAAMNSEELLCAMEIDRHKNVVRWIRNTEHESHGGFWLPKSPGRFFPDFIVELKNGCIALVEYKNARIAYAPEEQHKRTVGELWAGRSNGKGRFAWIIDQDWNELERQLSDRTT
jgi:type III restriction enzyme